jgi:hypothetical protein
MFVGKKIMMMCALSMIVFSSVTSWAMDVINAKIVLLKDEKSKLNRALVTEYGDSTIAYRAASKNVSDTIDQKIAELNREKVRLQSKL